MHGFTPNYIRVEMPVSGTLTDNALVKVRLGEYNADGTALCASEI